MLAAPVTKDDGESAYGGEDNLSSTASISSSIFEYRAIRGRKYHSERHQGHYFAPIDERQNESGDIAHHYLTLLFDGKLFLAPIKKDISKTLDVGTGTGIWATDFADEFPNTEIIGTDLSPIQPGWVPPNVRFEIEDATLPWTFPESTFDFIHMRYLFGSIADWSALFREAFSACAPGGWVESLEVEVDYVSDDGTRGWAEDGAAVYHLAGPPAEEGMEEAGFINIQEFDRKVPMGGWPLDTKLAEVGRFVQLGFENDLEGYSSLVWNTILGWPADEYQAFLTNTRKELNDPNIHPYFWIRTLYGQKPV